MAKNQKNETTGAADAPVKTVSLVTQYIKDLSFESPRAPHSMLGLKERPQINVNVDVKAGVVDKEKNLYEVALVISVTTKQGEETLFVNELAYAGLFAAINLTEAELEHALLIYAPGLLFPFARRVIADVSRDGGFPPLLLDPLDFAQLFNLRKQQEELQKNAASAPSSAQLN